MEKEEMRAFVLKMFQKEKAIWRAWAAQGNQGANGHLERTNAAERAFYEAMEAIQEAVDHD
jgi:hypothetical protein